MNKRQFVVIVAYGVIVSATCVHAAMRIDRLEWMWYCAAVANAIACVLAIILAVANGKGAKVVHIYLSVAAPLLIGGAALMSAQTAGDEFISVLIMVLGIVAAISQFGSSNIRR